MHWTYLKVPRLCLRITVWVIVSIVCELRSLTLAP